MFYRDALIYFYSEKHRKRSVRVRSLAAQYSCLECRTRRRLYPGSSEITETPDRIINFQEAVQIFQDYLGKLHSN